MDMLSEANRKFRLSRPLTPEGKRLTLWHTSERFIHCCIESRGCRFSKDCGACIMCDYGEGRNLEPSELLESVDKMLKPYKDKLDLLLLGSYGSIFDEYEIPADCFDVVLDTLVEINPRTAIFETHYSTVTESKLLLVLNKMPRNMNLIIEMGFESSDPFVLKYCLGKVMDLTELSRAIDLIHRHSASVCLNIFLGAPFICEADQLETAWQSVMWAFEHGADSIVIFPANIKPFTLLHELYKNGFYEPVSHWLLIKLLSRIPADLLDRVSFAWYGDRENFYENNAYPLIPPESCEVCRNILFGFYNAFMAESDTTSRFRLITELMSLDAVCACNERLEERLKTWTERPSASNIGNIIRDCTAL